MINTIMKIFSILLFFHFSLQSVAQDDDNGRRQRDFKSRKGFHAGFYMGSYFANKYTSALYDGYGYDANGVKNDFINSLMNKRINFDYGGGNGLADQVAVALNVNPGDWSFTQTDMPLKVKYNPSILVGIHMMYGFTQKNALIFNISGTKLNLAGNFTITLNTLPIGPTQPGYQNIKIFSITGAEQRVLFQIGYRRIIGDDDMFNFFIEEGMAVNMAKLVKNQIAINNLPIDLTSYYNNYNIYNGFRAKYLTGVGLGAFAGIGLNLTVNPKCNIQLVYNPSYEKINIGIDPTLKLQHSIGIRIYYIV